MSNSNNVILTGGLVEDPDVQTNRDGSHRVTLRVATKRDYADRDGQYRSDVVEVRSEYLQADKGLGGFANLRKGTLITMSGRVAREIFERKVTVTLEDGSKAKGSFTDSKDVVYVDLRGFTILRQPHGGSAAKEVEELVNAAVAEIQDDEA